MFLAEDFNGGEPAAPETREMVILWSLRCLGAAMADAGPMARSPRVEAALLRQFGPAGQELGVLLRCLAQVLQREAGTVCASISGCAMPGCSARYCLGAAPLDADEQLVLAALRRPERVLLTGLANTTAATAAGELLPLIAMLMRRSG